MKISKNIFSLMALVAFVATLSMPFASEARRGKGHGKKAAHSMGHKKSKKSKKSSVGGSEAPATTAAPAAPAAPGQ
jgi:hypothetical protein